MKSTIKVYLTVSVILWLLMTSCFNQEAKKSEQLEQQKLALKTSITSLLQSDIKISGISNGDCTKQAAAMRVLDLSQCPSEFATAYVAHIHAWEYAAKIQRARAKLNSDESVQDILISEGLKEALGTDSNPLIDALEADNELKKLANVATDRVTETYNRLELIATRYGASLPH
ncbi:MAG: hypothetical protein H7257_03645 [Taibaiella sp.]|nr:hypothetical protein [Taibaiella sp.]